MPHRGYDIFFPDPGKYKEMKCRVCNTLCTVERNKEGHISLASAMSGTKYKHDCFCCPHTGKDWHEYVITLIKEFNDTKSKRLKDLIEADINDELSKISETMYWDRE